MEIAVQTNVWSAERHRDLNGLLAEVAAAGYAGFEIGAHRIDLTQPDAFRALADTHRLTPTGLHVHAELFNPAAMPDALERTAEAARFARAVGAACVLLSGRPKPAGKSNNDLEVEVQWLNRAGERCLQAGLPLFYHTHNWELADDLRELRWLMTRTDPALVSLALDIGWVERAGYAPAAVIGEFAGRIRYYHLKDTRDDRWTEVGRGTLDFPAALKAINAAGFDGWLTVERDEVLPEPLAGVRQSREFLKGLGL